MRCVALASVADTDTDYYIVHTQYTHNQTDNWKTTSSLFTSTQCLNCEKRSGGTLEARRRRRRDERRRRENRGAIGAKGGGEWGGGVSKNVTMFTYTDHIQGHSFKR